MSGSWQGETAHRWAQLRLEQTDPKPNNPEAWMASLKRSLLSDRPETLRLLEADNLSPIAAAFWLLDHPTEHTTGHTRADREGADYTRVVPLGDPDCESCHGMGLASTDAGAVRCKCRGAA